MNHLMKKAFSSLVFVPKYGYHFPNPTSIVHEKVHFCFYQARAHRQETNQRHQLQTQQVWPRQVERKFISKPGRPHQFPHPLEGRRRIHRCWNLSTSPRSPRKRIRHWCQGQTRLNFGCLTSFPRRHATPRCSMNQWYIQTNIFILIYLLSSLLILKISYWKSQINLYIKIRFEINEWFSVQQSHNNRMKLFGLRIDRLFQIKFQKFQYFRSINLNRS